MEEPRQLGQYRIDSELSRSSICTVYRGYEAGLDRPVLIKQLHPQMVSDDEVRLRFEREAQVCARVKSENIVDIYAYTATADDSMLVLEFVEGKSLGKLVSGDQPIAWQTALRIFHQILKGLAFAHSKGVVHRDIKPDNILVSYTGIVKITDFGLAVIKNSSRLTQQGMIVGTPAYIPPEAVGGADIEEPGDLFSLGATVYEMLTGSSPFQGGTVPETLNNILNETPPPPSTLVPAIPKGLDNIVLTLIEKQPKKRFSSADQALSAVETVAREQGIDLNDRESVRLIVNDSSEPTANSTTRPSTRSMRSYYTKRGRYGGKWTAIIGVLALVILVLFMARQWYNTQDNFVPTKPISENGLTTEPVTQSNSNRETARIDSLNAVARKQNPIEALSGRDMTAGESGTVQLSQVTATPIKTARPIVKDTSSATNSGNGWVTISAQPWAQVSIGTTDYGEILAPKRFELPAGEHTIVFLNNNYSAPITRTISITPGKEQTVALNWADHFGSILIANVIPWGHIYVNSRYYGETPRKHPILVPHGHNRVEIRSPGLPTFKKDITISPSNPQEIISVDLNSLPKE